jgi:hypothetical protein
MAKWWVPATVQQAVLMLRVSKKTPGILRTVFDLRQQNDNTVMDVTPFPDQDMIWHDMAWSQYRSKLDLTEVYKQIHVELKDIHKTAFAMIIGTFMSNVLQMGDMNGPSSVKA